MHDIPGHSISADDIPETFSVLRMTTTTRQRGGRQRDYFIDRQGKNRYCCVVHNLDNPYQYDVLYPS